MNERKAMFAGLGLSLLVAAGGAMAADPPGGANKNQPAPTQPGSKGNDAAMLACTKAELEVAQKAGRSADQCKADKTHASGGGGGTGKGVDAGKAAPPARF